MPFKKRKKIENLMVAGTTTPMVIPYVPTEEVSVLGPDGNIYSVKVPRNLRAFMLDHLNRISAKLALFWDLHGPSVDPAEYRKHRESIVNEILGQRVHLDITPAALDLEAMTPAQLAALYAVLEIRSGQELKALPSNVLVGEIIDVEQYRVEKEEQGESEGAFSEKSPQAHRGIQKEIQGVDISTPSPIDSRGIREPVSEAGSGVCDMPQAPRQAQAGHRTRSLDRKSQGPGLSSLQLDDMSLLRQYRHTNEGSDIPQGGEVNECTDERNQEVVREISGGERSGDPRSGTVSPVDSGRDGLSGIEEKLGSGSDRGRDSETSTRDASAPGGSAGVSAESRRKARDVVRESSKKLDEVLRALRETGGGK